MFKSLIKISLTKKQQPQLSSLNVKTIQQQRHISKVWFSSLTQVFYHEHFNQQLATTKVLDRFKEELPNMDIVNKKVKNFSLTLSQSQVRHKVALTEAEMKEKHPFEHFVGQERSKDDIFASISPQHLVVTNLPTLTKKSVIVEAINKIDGVQIKQVYLKESLSSDQLAYIIVELRSEEEVKLVKSKLRNYWIKDKLVKLRTLDDQESEVFDDRTIIVRDLPKRMRQDKIIELFKSFGAIVRIELPTQNERIQDELDTRNIETDPFLREKREHEEWMFQKDQNKFKERLLTDPQYQEGLSSIIGVDIVQGMMNSYSEEQTQQVLAHSHDMSVSTIMTHLQSEQMHVQTSQEILNSLKSEQNEGGFLSGNSQQNKNQDVKEQIQQNKEQIVSIVKYLQKNQETLQGKEDQLKHIFKSGVMKDPIEELMEMNREELSLACDKLITILGQRQEIIEKRIQNEIRYLGKDERILIAEKDFTQEFEELPQTQDAFKDQVKPEMILSLNEQIQNVKQSHDEYSNKELRLKKLLMGQLNPFEKANFSEEMIANGQNPNFDHKREFPDIDLTQPASIARVLYRRRPYYDEALQEINEMVEDLKSKMDVPFDEVYHREKHLVQEVIKAQKALKEKVKQQQNPLVERKFNPKDFKQMDFGMVDSDLETDHQFLREGSLVKDGVLQGENNNEIFTPRLLEIQNDFEKMRQEGLISEQDYDRMKVELKSNDVVNLGYALVTFSHKDEAKKVIISATEDDYFSSSNLKAFLKGGVDHGDLDFQYKINKMKNDAEIVDELKKVREATTDLQHFESTLDQQLPRNEQFKQFRELAKDIIEDKPLQTRNSQKQKRTSYEEERLREKIRQMQKENKEIDFTQLFESEYSENAKKALHKKAFASYKAFEFLKNGVETQKVKEKIEKSTKYSDPYEFPNSEEHVSNMFTNENKYKVMNRGMMSSLSQPGRKFKYTNEDFLKSYLGQDYDQVPDFNSEEYQLFGFNDSFKKKYPIEKYKMQKMFEKQRDELNEMVDEDDQEVQWLRENIDWRKEAENEDIKHPNNSNRTLMKDINHKINDLKQRAKDKGLQKLSGRDIGKSVYRLKKEYGEQMTGFQRRKKRPTRLSVYDYSSREFSTDNNGVDNKEKLRAKFNRDPEFKPRIRETESHYKTPQIKLNYQLSEEEIAELKEKNKDFVYEYEHSKKNDLDMHWPLDVKQIEEVAKYNSKTPQEMIQQMKYLKQFRQEPKAGAYENRLLRDEIEKDFSGEMVSRSLGDFADESVSEREEGDIFKHYEEVLKKDTESEQAIQKQKQVVKMLKQMEQQEDFLPENPRFQDYFASESKDQHVFASQKYLYNQQVEEQDERYLYERELRGRLMGQKLSNRQFQVLMKMEEGTGTGEQIRLVKDKQHKQFIENRDRIRLYEEKLESQRRKNVIDGVWTEEESFSKLKQLVMQQKAEEPLKSIAAENKLAEKKLQEQLSMIDYPDRIFEKEYYFDEGLGESLEEHAKKLQKIIPKIQVETRRDNDGFAIVKTKLKKNYKYNLKEIENFNAQETISTYNETIEALAKTIFKNGDNFDKIDKAELEEGMLRLQGKGGDLNAATKQQVDDLVNQRINGIYKNDLDGFVQKFKEISSKSNKSEKLLFYENRVEMKDQIMEEMFQDRHQMAEEISAQIKSRIYEKLYMKERESTDFVTGRRSEIDVFGLQATSVERSIEALVQEEAKMKSKEEKGFLSKTDYMNLKNELKMRKQYKEELLKQKGMPILDHYVRI